MRMLFWVAAAIAGVLASLAGFYVRFWIEDPFPVNLLLAGHHITVLLALSTGFCLFALAAWKSRPRRPDGQGPGMMARRVG